MPISSPRMTWSGSRGESSLKHAGFNLKFDSTGSQKEDEDDG